MQRSTKFSTLNLVQYVYTAVYTQLMYVLRALNLAPRPMPCLLLEYLQNLVYLRRITLKRLSHTVLVQLYTAVYTTKKYSTTLPMRGNGTKFSTILRVVPYSSPV
jgi:hypothetical protein